MHFKSFNNLECTFFTKRRFCAKYNGSLKIHYSKLFFWDYMAIVRVAIFVSTVLTRGINS